MYYSIELMLYFSSFLYFFLFLINLSFKSFTRNQIFFSFIILLFSVGFILCYQLFTINNNLIYINSLYLYSKGLIALKTVIIFFFLFYFIFISKQSLIYINLEIFFFLILNFILSLFGIASSNNFFLIFIFLEFQTFITIILVSFLRYKKLSINGIFLYFLLTSLFAIYFLFSLLIIYGLFRTFTISEVSLLIDCCKSLNINILWIKISALFIFLNLLFKLASVPFHFWIRDVYMGATTPLLGFLTTVTKIPMFYLLLKMFTVFNIIEYNTSLIKLLFICGVLSLIYGTLLTVKQTTIKTFLICSSITHVGFLLILLMYIEDRFYLINLFGYLINYTFTLMGLWIILTRVYEFSIRDDFAFTRLSLYFKYYKKLGIVFCSALLSLAGLPPFIGFFFKYNIFLALYNDYHYFALTLSILIGAFTLYYYLKLVKLIFLDKLFNTTNILLQIKLFFSKKKNIYFFLIGLCVLTLLFFLCYDLIIIVSRHITKHII